MTSKDKNVDAKELITEPKTVEQIIDLRKSIGQKDKKIENSSAEFSSIPEEGVFARIGVKEFTLTNDDKTTTVVKSLGLFTKNEDFISENAITKQHLEEVLTSVKTGDRRGKFILKSERLTNLNRFGKSLNEQMLNLVGKSFTTVKKDVRNYRQQYLTSETFDQVCQKDNDDEALQNALSKTEIVNGYKFIIS